MAKVAKKIQVKLKRGLAGKKQVEIRTAMALGLRKTNQVREHKDCPEIRGMIRRIGHLVEVIEG